jgi:hypothetical protein
MRNLILLAGLLLLCACGASGTPVDEASVQAVLEQHLAVIANGIVREDPVLASQPASASFTMGANPGVRYLDSGWSGTGVQAFRNYWEAVVGLYENISINLEIKSLDVNGDVATAVVDSKFSAVKMSSVPPESVTADGHDYMIWQLEPKGWRLIMWDEAPAEDATPAE